MSTLEPDLDAALIEHDLIVNPRRAAEFFALVDTPRESRPVTAKIKKTQNGMILAVGLYTPAFIIGALAVAGVVDPIAAGFISLMLVIGGTVVIFATGRTGKITAEDIATGHNDIDPDVAIDAGWLDELPMETIESLDAQGRWDAAAFMVEITADGIPEVGTDYNDPTFEDRFSDARRERTLAYLAERRR